jgi:hypothetical protein
MAESARRSVVLDFEVQLTPVMQRPSKASVHALISQLGLESSAVLLKKEAARLERLAKKNENRNLINGAQSKRGRAEAYRKAAALMGNIVAQINGMPHA